MQSRSKQYRSARNQARRKNLEPPTKIDEPPFGLNPNLCSCPFFLPKGQISDELKIPLDYLSNPDSTDLPTINWIIVGACFGYLIENNLLVPSEPIMEHIDHFLTQFLPYFKKPESEMLKETFIELILAQLVPFLLEVPSSISDLNF